MTFPRPKRDEAAAKRFYGRLAPESAALKRQLEERATPLVNDLVDLTIGTSFVETLLGKPRIRQYLGKNHGPTLGKLEKLLAELNTSRSDPEEGTMTLWSISRAKKELEEVIRQSRTEGPQMIKRLHWPVVMVICVRRWRAMLRRYPELEEFFWQRKIRRTEDSITKEVAGREVKPGKKRVQASSIRKDRRSAQAGARK